MATLGVRGASWRGVRNTSRMLEEKAGDLEME